MDMVFRDDECRVRTDNAPTNFVTLKHMAHNLIRRAPGKDSQRLKRMTAAWDDLGDSDLPHDQPLPCRKGRDHVDRLLGALFGAGAT